MKKIAPIVAIALGAMFTSCKKDYTCTCKDSSGGQSYTITYPKTKKATAETACGLLNIAYGTCTLN